MGYDHGGRAQRMRSRAARQRRYSIGEQHRHSARSGEVEARAAWLLVARPTDKQAQKSTGGDRCTGPMDADG
jgi:hypothetical protein